jgi:PAS domain-containing protein
MNARIRRLADLAEQLDDKELKLNKFFYNSPDMLSIVDYEGNVILSNPAFSAAIDVENLIGVNLYDIVKEEDRFKINSTLGSEGKIFRLNLLKSSGDYISTEWRSFDDKNGLIYCIARNLLDLECRRRSTDGG